MPRLVRHCLFLLACLCGTIIIAGCSEPEQSENVFQGQVDALDKAKQVEGTLLQTDQRQRQQVERDSQ